MKFNEKIKELRKKHGLSQQELAEKAGIHITFLSRLENGHNDPSLDLFRKFTEIFEISADYLLKDDEDSYDVQIQDKSLAEKIRLIDSLDDRSREALAQIIEQMLTNKRMREVLSDLSETKAS